MSAFAVIQQVVAGSPRTPEVDAALLRRELQAVEADTHWAEYFLHLADGRVIANDAQSALAYVLYITDDEPVGAGPTAFEFDMPDVDLDFCDNRRDEVFRYLRERYGRDHVAKLGAVATFGAKAAMNTVSDTLGVPPRDVEQLMESLVTPLDGENALAATFATPAGIGFLAQHPEMQIAARMEHHPSHGTQHAAAVILTGPPIADFAGIDSRTGAAHCDKRGAETRGLLKIDVLGVTQLSIFADALTLAGLPHDHLDRIPTDDPDAFRVFNERRFAGVSQFSGDTLRALAGQITFETLEDIAAASALARPGPILCGGTAAWVRRKTGLEAIAYPHPSFAAITESTLGIVTYQEQVLRIARDIGDLSWADATGLRKAMSKSAGAVVFNRYGEAWKRGAARRGVPDTVCDTAWDELIAFGRYGFVKAHAVAYALVSYQCAWLKAHHSLEFAAATLTHETDPDKQIKLLRELAVEGIGYLPVHATLSTDMWQVGTVDGEKRLIGPVSNLCGCGPKTVAAVVAAHARGDPLPDRVRKLLAKGVTKIDSLWPIRDRTQTLLPDLTAREIYGTPVPIEQVLSDRHRTEVLLICTISKATTKNENAIETVQKRGWVIKGGPTTSLNLTLKDDTGQIFGKIDRSLMATLGRDILDHGRGANSIYAIRGQSWGHSLRGVSVEAVRFIGLLREPAAKTAKPTQTAA